jgi:hypothetical protein
MIRVKPQPDDAMWSEMAADVKRDLLADTLPVVDAAGERLTTEVRLRLTRLRGRPSTAGEAPAQQSGDLARSFSKMPARIGRNGSSIVGGTKSTEDYRKIGALEYGSTEGGRHLAARPFLRPAAEVAMQQMDDELGRTL